MSGSRGNARPDPSAIVDAMIRAAVESGDPMAVIGAEALDICGRAARAAF